MRLKIIILLTIAISALVVAPLSRANRQRKHMDDRHNASFLSSRL